eukprot:251277-Rhodomonas_salina.1
MDIDLPLDTRVPLVPGGYPGTRDPGYPGTRVPGVNTGYPGVEPWLYPATGILQVPRPVLMSSYARVSAQKFTRCQR